MTTNLFDLTGKVAIITGASRGIGQAIAEQFAAAGANIAISSRKQESLDATAAELSANGANVLPIAAHNGDKAALETLVKRTVDHYGKVDILVNNAATNPHFGYALDAEDSHWQKTMEVNIMGNMWLTKFCVAVMREHGGGKIINVASVAGLRPGHFQGIYSMTKAAVISLTKTFAMELGADNIQVNAIAPGLVKTYFAKTLWENDDLRKQVELRTPVGRLGEPIDIAGIALYLASRASDFATGQVFVVDGGLLVPSL